MARILPATSRKKLAPMIMWRTAREKHEYLLLPVEKLPTHRTIIDIILRVERAGDGMVFVSVVLGFVVMAVDNDGMRKRMYYDAG